MSVTTYPCLVQVLRPSVLGVGMSSTLVQPSDDPVEVELPAKLDAEGRPVNPPAVDYSANLRLIEILPAPSLAEEEKPSDLPDGAIFAGGFWLVPDESGAYHKWGAPGGVAAELTPVDPIAQASAGPLAGAADLNAPATPLVQLDAEMSAKIDGMNKATVTAFILNKGGTPAGDLPTLQAAAKALAAKG